MRPDEDVTEYVMKVLKDCRFDEEAGTVDADQLRVILHGDVSRVKEKTDTWVVRKDGVVLGTFDDLGAPAFAYKLAVNNAPAEIINVVEKTDTITFNYSVSSTEET